MWVNGGRCLIVLYTYMIIAREILGRANPFFLGSRLLALVV